MKKETLCKVHTIDGVQFLFMPDGTKIPHVAMTRITQDCTAPGYPIAVAVVKMFVWVEDTVVQYVTMPLSEPILSELDEKAKKHLRDIPDADTPKK